MYAEEETPSGWRRINQITYDATTATPAVLKTGAMGADRVFYAMRFAGWVYNVKDGLSTDFGVGLACTFATCAIVDNWWGRGYSMIRRERNPNALLNTQNPDAGWFTTGINGASFFNTGGYIVIQGVSILYMINSIPGSSLNALSVAKLIARLSGTTFNAFCDASKGEGPASSQALIALAHITGMCLAYSTISSFLSYNTPQIRNYYINLFVKNEIWKVSRHTWFHTSTGTLVNTLGIAFAGIAAWNLLEDEALCYAGVGIPHWFKVGWVMQSCIVNIIMNGMMTLYAVHQHHNNEHNRARNRLDAEIEISFEWDKTIRIAIIGNSIAALCATMVQVPNLPGSFDDHYKYLAYSALLILMAVPLAVIAFSNQFALSSESDVRERVVRKDEKKAAANELHSSAQAQIQQAEVELVQLNARAQRVSIYGKRNNSHTFYGSNGHTLANGHQPVAEPAEPVARRSFWSSLPFFNSTPAEIAAPSETERLLANLEEGRSSYRCEQEPEQKAWCGIM